MDHYERQEKKREAMRRLQTQRRRAGLLRGRVIVTSIVAFAMLWAVVFAQMATGNDPVLSAKSTGTVASTPRRHAKARKHRSEAVEPEVVEVEPEFVGPEVVEVEPEFVEPEPEIEEFVEEPAPVTTSQS